MARVLLIAACCLVLGISDAAFAQPPGTGGQESLTAGREFPMAKGVAIIGGCFGAALCAAGGGYAISRLGSSCIDSIARQPEAGHAMFAPLVIAAAMIEGGMLFAIVACLYGISMI